MGYIIKDRYERAWKQFEWGHPENAAAAKKLASDLKVSEAFARLLVFRGYDTAEKAGGFINTGDVLFHDPFLLKDCRKACEIILSAVRDGKKITIYGDYDVDGVTSVSVLYLYLSSIGGNCDYHIPVRLGEGYGMSVSAVRSIVESGTQLIITVDTGITACEEVSFAKESGVEVVVTDHHECTSELPAADAVVNPKRLDCDYPFDKLAGVGVVFKLVCAMEMIRNPERSPVDSVLKVAREYADLIALGTIADVMPIEDENRLIVKYGLQKMNEGNRTSINALMEEIQAMKSGGTERKYSYKRPLPEITSTFIGYNLAPRINAAGRIENASVAVELFLTDSQERAHEIARNLCCINLRRQEEEEKIAKQAYAKIEAEHDFEHDPVIVLADDGWHHGVIGIVASKITEKYGLPSILISFDGASENGDETERELGKGSGRSLKGMNLVEALTYCSDCLEKYGGHELAAGLTIKRGMVEEFTRKINEYARGVFSEDPTERMSLGYDIELKPEDMTLQFANELKMLEPCGTANPVPVFVMHNVSVRAISGMSSNKHSRFYVVGRDRETEAIFFSRSPEDLGMTEEERVDIMFNANINDYHGVKTLQMICKDIRESEKGASMRQTEKQRFEDLEAGAPLKMGEDAVPDRNDIATLYSFLRREGRMGNTEFPMRTLVNLLCDGNGGLNYVKIRFAIKVLGELGMLTYTESDETYTITLSQNPSRKDLDTSPTLHGLREQQKKVNNG